MESNIEMQLLTWWVPRCIRPLGLFSWAWPMNTMATPITPMNSDVSMHALCTCGVYVYACSTKKKSMLLDSFKGEVFFQHPPTPLYSSSLYLVCTRA